MAEEQFGFQIGDRVEVTPEFTEVHTATVVGFTDFFVVTERALFPGWQNQWYPHRLKLIERPGDKDSGPEFINCKWAPEEPEDDPVNHPSHYTFGKYEVLDVIEDWDLGFHLGNAVKYIARAGRKDPTKEKQDLEKAIFLINRRITQISD